MPVCFYVNGKPVFSVPTAKLLILIHGVCVFVVKLLCVKKHSQKWIHRNRYWLEVDTESIPENQFVVYITEQTSFLNFF